MRLRVTSAPRFQNPSALRAGSATGVAVHHELGADTRPPVTRRYTKSTGWHQVGSVVTVEDFVDPTGSTAYDRDLSQHRAEAVRDRLV